MKIDIEGKVRVVCCQHPNGEIFLETEMLDGPHRIPNHYSVLAERIIDTSFNVDGGYNPNRAYPKGSVSQG